MYQKIKQKDLAIPHKSQLSKSRIKLDMVLMCLRQLEWNIGCGDSDCPDSSGWFVYLSADASPQGSLEYFLVLEDRVSRKQAAAIVGATPEERDQWCTQEHLRTTTFPATILGSGRTSAASKFEALLHAVCLDTMHNGDPLQVMRYSESVVSYCSDYGAEANLSQIPKICIEEFLDSNISNSGGLLASRQSMAAQHLGAIQADASEVGGVITVDDDAALAPPPAPMPEQKSFFCLLSALLVPGVKHMFDNVRKELLHSLHHYGTFSDAWLQVSKVVGGSDQTRSHDDRKMCACLFARHS